MFLYSFITYINLIILFQEMKYIYPDSVIHASWKRSLFAV